MHAEMQSQATICFAKQSPGQQKTIMSKQVYNINIYIYMFYIRHVHALAEDVYEQASIQYHSIRDLAAYTTPSACIPQYVLPLVETSPYHSDTTVVYCIFVSSIYHDQIYHSCPRGSALAYSTELSEQAKHQ